MDYLDTFPNQLTVSTFIFIVTAPMKIIFHRYLPLNPAVKLDRIMERIKEGPIAHRGGIPENTITAFTIAKKSGASTIEVDLRFSKDGHPVLFHDRKVDRVSDQSGNLADLTLDQIKSLDVGHKFGYAGARVPTLSEGVEAIKELDLRMFLEIKRCDKHGIAILTELFQQDPSLYDRIIIISFFPHVLYKIRLHDPNIVVGLILTHASLAEDRWRYNIFTVIMDYIIYHFLSRYVWKFLGVGLLLTDKDDILSKRFNLEYYHKRGNRHVVTWTVNSKQEQEYFSTDLQIPYMTDNVNV